MTNGIGYAQMRSAGPSMGQGGGYGASSSQMRSMPYGRGALEVPNPGSGYSPAKPNEDQFAAVRGHAGGLAWPVALRYLTRDGAWKETREQIDAGVDQLSASRARKSSNLALVERLRDDVAKVREHFNRESEDLPVTRQQEADAVLFLNRVRDALKQFRSDL